MSAFMKRNIDMKTICISNFFWLRFAQQHCVAANDNTPKAPTPVEMKLAA